MQQRTTENKLKEHKITVLDYLRAALARVVLLESQVYQQIHFWRVDRAMKRWKQSQSQARKATPKQDYDVADDEDEKLRLQLVEVIGIGQSLRANLMAFRALGRNYRKSKDPSVSLAARGLYRDCDHVLLAMDWTEGGLWLRLQVRRIWKRDNSDLAEFWKTRFEASYNRLEESTKKVAGLAEPELHERFVKKLAAERPLLTLPRTPEDAARRALQRFKSMMWSLVPMTTAMMRSMVDLAEGEGSPEEWFGRREKRSAEVGQRVREKMRRTVELLPEGEREMEMDEINELLKRHGY